ncbi:MAG: hypothetical protein WCK77_15450 [Verrucomicrobiota bacterium]
MAKPHADPITLATAGAKGACGAGIVDSLVVPEAEMTAEDGGAAEVRLRVLGHGSAVGTGTLARMRGFHTRAVNGMPLVTPDLSAVRSAVCLAEPRWEYAGWAAAAHS